MIRLAIDYRMCRSAGIGVYLRNIVPRLLQKTAGHYAVTLVGGDPHPGVAHVPFEAPIYSPLEQLLLPLRIPRDTDLFWSPNYNAPVVSPGKLVVTIHDACHLAHPEFFGSRVKHLASRAMFANCRRRARDIVCVSQFTVDEVGRLAGISAHRCTVIHSGIDADFGSNTGSRPIEKPYLLFVGNVKPHKNLAGLLRAFESIADRVDHGLVIVGKREGFITPDRSVIGAAERLGSRVLFTGELSDALVESHFAHASALVYPSFYEGFGFPPLQAMACGVPVAASRIAAIPEICGDAVEYFDPHSTTDMARALLTVLLDETRRQKLRDLGEQQVRRFSWDDSVDRLIRLFDALTG